MKIFRVVPDVNQYQYFMLNDQTLELSEMMTFDGTPSKADTWSAPSVHIHNSNLRRGAFFSLWGTEAIVVDETALEQLEDLLEMCGELLALPHCDRMYHVLNVTECVSVLDEDRTQWRYQDRRPPIDKYVFHADRLTEAPLFRIPETRKSEILTVEGMKDPEDEFKFRVEQKGLQGLLFEEIWSDGSLPKCSDN